MAQAIPILSLVIALLAVFVGPFVSWHITKRQIESSARLANKQIAAPLQIAWANELRKLLAELCTIGWFLTRLPLPPARPDAEIKRLIQLGHEIIMMLDPRQQSHQLLDKTISETARELTNKKDQAEGVAAINKLLGAAQAVIQTEYDHVREEA
jgi:hypothetical protein